MRFTSANSKYDINFRYVLVNVSRVQTMKTQCIISFVSSDIPSGRDEYLSLYIGVAYQDDRDVFVKETGRKIALARALAKNFSKPFRTKAWQAYHGRKNSANKIDQEDSKNGRTNYN